MKTNLDSLSQKNILALLPPYPIVLVSTRSNIITINQIQYFTFRPLRIGIAVAHVRHTYDLLKQEREFVINISNAALVDAVKFCGSHSGRKGDKFVAAGLTAEPSQVVKSASIAECPAHIEVRVEQELDFEHRTWFIGQVVAARTGEEHNGTSALLCGRTEYRLPGEIVAPR